MDRAHNFLLWAAIVATLGCGNGVPTFLGERDGASDAMLLLDAFDGGTDIMIPADSRDARADAPYFDADVARDVRDTGLAVVRAGRPCTSNEDCDSVDLYCDRSLNAEGFCTSFCEPGTASEEESRCGGRGSTCRLRSTQQIPNVPGEGTRTDALCARACIPTADTEARGQCRDGQVCTTFWFNQPDASLDPPSDDSGLVASTLPEPWLVYDRPGCYPFCQDDAYCRGDAGQMVCNRRLGRCTDADAGASSDLRPDGAPCNPREIAMTGRAQCRGMCFGVERSDSHSLPTMHGLCGSLILFNPRNPSASRCFDTPERYRPLTGRNDNLALCLYRDCTSNQGCDPPTICIYPEDQHGYPTGRVRVCGYPTGSQHNGIPSP